MGWYCEGNLIPASYVVPSHDITLTASWNVLYYNVTFESGCDVQFAPMYDAYGTHLDLPVLSREGYTFEGWFEGNKKFESDRIPARDLNLVAKWIIDRYTVVFEIDGVPMDGYPLSVDYGTILELPPMVPIKVPTDSCEYIFEKWIGYDHNMVVRGDLTFSAFFIAMITTCPEITDDGTIDFVIDGAEEIVFSHDVIEEIKQQIQESESVKVEVSHGSIELDKGSVTKLDGEKKVSMTKVEKDDIPDELPVEAKVRPVFEVSVGDVHDFDGGKLTITFKYQLLEGENADYLQIWHFKDDGTYEVEECVYDNVRKCIVFSTGTLSYFSVMHVEPDPTPNPGPGPNPNPGPTPSPSDDDEGGSNMAVFIGAGAAAVVVIGLVVFFLIRRKA